MTEPQAISIDLLLRLYRSMYEMKCAHSNYVCSRHILCGDQVLPRPTLRLVLTVDHRVADGVAGARFLSSIAHRLENPARLLI